MSKLKINRIRGYGCSFTLGEESGDHDIGVMPYKKDYKTTKEIDKDKKASKSLHNFYDQYCTENSIHITEHYNKPNSYVNQLANNLGVDIVNRAVSGSSNLGSIYKIQNDYLAGEIKDTDFIILGLTTKERFPWIDVLLQNNPDPDRLFTFMPQHDNSSFLQFFTPEFLKELKLFFHGDECELLATYFLNSVFTWYHILKGRLLLVPAAADLVNSPGAHGSLFYSDNIKDHDKIMKTLKFYQNLLQGIYLPEVSMNYEFNLFTPHVGYHPNKLHHKKFARKIKNFIEDKIEVIK